MGRRNWQHPFDRAHDDGGGDGSRGGFSFMRGRVLRGRERTFCLVLGGAF